MRIDEILIDSRVRIKSYRFINFVRISGKKIVTSDMKTLGVSKKYIYLEKKIKLSVS